MGELHTSVCVDRFQSAQGTTASLAKTYGLAAKDHFDATETNAWQTLATVRRYAGTTMGPEWGGPVLGSTDDP